MLNMRELVKKVIEHMIPFPDCYNDKIIEGYTDILMERLELEDTEISTEDIIYAATEYRNSTRTNQYVEELAFIQGAIWRDSKITKL